MRDLALYAYVKGWWLLLLSNVLFLFKAPPFEVWILFNGMSLVLILAGRLSTMQRSPKD
jgi:hypothetical protein